MAASSFEKVTVTPFMKTLPTESAFRFHDIVRFPKCLLVPYADNSKYRDHNASDDDRSFL